MYSHFQGLTLQAFIVYLCCVCERKFANSLFDAVQPQEECICTVNLACLSGERLTQLSGLSVSGLSGNLAKDKAASWSHNSLQYRNVWHTEQTQKTWKAKRKACHYTYMIAVLSRAT